jgi:hypothetical protein
VWEWAIPPDVYVDPDMVEEYLRQKNLDGPL